MSKIIPGYEFAAENCQRVGDDCDHGVEVQEFCPDCEIENAEEPLKCQWFTACRRPVEGVLDHPTLGAVPVCGPCRQTIEAL